VLGDAVAQEKKKSAEEEGNRKKKLLTQLKGKGLATLQRMGGNGREFPQKGKAKKGGQICEG